MVPCKHSTKVNREMHNRLFRFEKAKLHIYIPLPDYLLTKVIIQLKVVYWGTGERHVGGLKAEASSGLQSPETMLCVSVNDI